MHWSLLTDMTLETGKGKLIILPLGEAPEKSSTVTSELKDTNKL